MFRRRQQIGWIWARLGKLGVWVDFERDERISVILVIFEGSVERSDLRVSRSSWVSGDIGGSCWFILENLFAWLLSILFFLRKDIMNCSLLFKYSGLET